MDGGGLSLEAAQIAHRSGDDPFEGHLGVGFGIFGPDKVSAHRVGNDAGGARAEEWIEHGVAGVR